MKMIWSYPGQQLETTKTQLSPPDKVLMKMSSSHLLHNLIVSLTWKIQVTQRDSNPLPLRCRCSECSNQLRYEVTQSQQWHWWFAIWTTCVRKELEQKDFALSPVQHWIRSAKGFSMMRRRLELWKKVLGELQFTSADETKASRKSRDHWVTSEKSLRNTHHQRFRMSF